MTKRGKCTLEKEIVMLTIEEIAEHLEEEQILFELFSEDAFNGKTALTYESSDLLLAISVNRGEEISLYIYEYETDDELTFTLISNEDDIAEFLPQLTSILNWWLKQHPTCLNRNTYKTLTAIVDALIEDGVYNEFFNPEDD